MQGDERTEAQAPEDPGDRAEQTAQVREAGPKPPSGTADPQRATSPRERAVLAKRRELAAHERAINRHEQAVTLQERFGHPERAATARRHAEHARNLRDQVLRQLQEEEGTPPGG
jgi:hypothetical protein